MFPPPAGFPGSPFPGMGPPFPPFGMPPFGMPPFGMMPPFGGPMGFHSPASLSPHFDDTKYSEVFKHHSSFCCC